MTIAESQNKDDMSHSEKESAQSVGSRRLIMFRQERASLLAWSLVHVAVEKARAEDASDCRWLLWMSLLLWGNLRPDQSGWVLGRGG